jgi:hypothetical protein
VVDVLLSTLLLWQVLKARDKNGDGELSFQEYIGDRGEGKDKEWLLTEKDRLAKNRSCCCGEKMSWKAKRCCAFTSRDVLMCRIGKPGQVTCDDQFLLNPPPPLKG